MAQAQAAAETYFRLCPPPDAQWFVDMALKPILVDVIINALAAVKEGDSQASVFAKLMCDGTMITGLARRLVCDLEAGHPGPHSGVDIESPGNHLACRWYWA
jgi:hypothetical protein